MEELHIAIVLRNEAFWIRLGYIHKIRLLAFDDRFLVGAFYRVVAYIRTYSLSGAAQPPKFGFGRHEGVERLSSFR